MSRSTLGSFALLLVIFSSNLKANTLEDISDFTGGDLIYGNDDRIEVDQFSNPDFITLSKSIAIRVSKRRLTEDRNDSTRILFPNIPLKKAMPQLCETERFVDQVSLGTCSGFLASPTKLVTAGHCMTTEQECSDNKWVFGFKEGVSELKSSQVYSCKKVISQRYIYNSHEVSDYAVIELDRPVEGYVPLKTRKFGRVFLNTPLVVIGHPLGLPMKATNGGVVSRMNEIERETKWKSFILRSNYFTANLDAYAGNSGSPVFNKRSGKVEGILIQGAEDFMYNSEKGCLESRRFSNSHLETYEKVMRVTKIPGLAN